MVIAIQAVHGKYTERPPACPDCSGACWWNGRRTVGVVRQQEDGTVSYETDVVRRRACCSSKQCLRGSFTVYDQDAYPHRVFALGVTVSAVGAVVFMGSTLTAAGRAHRCSRDHTSFQ